jgi:multiple sugar transport system permease protein
MNQIVHAHQSVYKSPRIGRNRSRRYGWGLLFVLPAIAVFALFLWMPIVKGVIYSFYTIDFVKGNTFIGFANYERALGEPAILIAVKNTLYYMFLGLIMGYWVPCVFAIAISELRWFQGFARIAAYLPNVVPIVVMYGLWRWFYDPVGPINGTLTQLGFEPIAFLTNPSWSMISIVFMETWQQFGSAMLIYLAGVLGIPRDHYEAAEIDGAGVWHRIRYITLPSIRNLLILLFLLQIIATSQGFQTQQALLEGGPNNTTLTYALLIIRYATTQLNYGVASALGVLMFLVLSVVALIHFRLSNKEEG